MQQPADNGSSGDSGHDRGYTLLQSLLTLEWFMQHHRETSTQLVVRDPVMNLKMLLTKDEHHSVNGL